MKHDKICNHCSQEYVASKKNQKYCSNSCRVTACYERNQYKYKSGYQKTTQQNQLVKQDKLQPQLKVLEEEKESGITEAFIGSGLAIAAENVIKTFVSKEDKPLTLKQSKALTKQLTQLIVKHDKMILSKLNTISRKLDNLDIY